MQDYITNNFHGISGMSSTSYILPGRMRGGRTREKSLCFPGLCIKHLHAHFFHVKNPNKKNLFPLKFAEIRNQPPLCARGHALPCSSAAQHVPTRPRLLARGYSRETVSASFGLQPARPIANATQSHKLRLAAGKGLLCVSGDLIVF